MFPCIGLKFGSASSVKTRSLDDFEDALQQQSHADWNALLRCLSHDIEHGTRQSVEHVARLLRERDAVRELCREEA